MWMALGSKVRLLGLLHVCLLVGGGEEAAHPQSAIGVGAQTCPWLHLGVQEHKQWLCSPCDPRVLPAAPLPSGGCSVLKWV